MTDQSQRDDTMIMAEDTSAGDMVVVDPDRGTLVRARDNRPLAKFFLMAEDVAAGSRVNITSGGYVRKEQTPHDLS